MVNARGHDRGPEPHVQSAIVAETLRESALCKVDPRGASGPAAEQASGQSADMPSASSGQYDVATGRRASDVPAGMPSASNGQYHVVNDRQASDFPAGIPSASSGQYDVAANRQASDVPTSMLAASIGQCHQVAKGPASGLPAGASQWYVMRGQAFVP